MLENKNPDATPAIANDAYREPNKGLFRSGWFRWAGMTMAVSTPPDAGAHSRAADGNLLASYSS